MIFEEIRKHKQEYFFLIFGLLSILASFLFFLHQPKIQIKIVFLGVVYYLFWGIFHHKKRGDLCLKVILDYLIIGIFALLIAFWLLRRL